MRKTIINKVSCYFILFIALCTVFAPSSEPEGRTGLSAQLITFVFAASTLYTGLDLLIGCRHVIQYILGLILYLMYGAICTINLGGGFISLLIAEHFVTATFDALVYVLIIAALINCLFGLNREGWLSSKKTGS